MVGSQLPPGRQVGARRLRTRCQAPCCNRRAARAPNIIHFCPPRLAKSARAIEAPRTTSGPHVQTTLMLTSHTAKPKRNCPDALQNASRYRPTRPSQQPHRCSCNTDTLVARGVAYTIPPKLSKPYMPPPSIWLAFKLVSKPPNTPCLDCQTPSQAPAPKRPPARLTKRPGNSCLKRYESSGGPERPAAHAALRKANSGRSRSCRGSCTSERQHISMRSSSDTPGAALWYARGACTRIRFHLGLIVVKSYATFAVGAETMMMICSLQDSTSLGLGLGLAYAHKSALHVHEGGSKVPAQSTAPHPSAASAAAQTPPARPA